ncbi:MAG: MFS transporter [Oscillospiraceae bacterium]|nr:MFS transporter [Oscillospiraceae bacterium]
MTEIDAEKQKNSRALMWTILLIALVQMAQPAITPGIDQIATDVFPEWSLQTIQTVMSLPSVMSIFAGVITAILVGFGLATKKALVVFGLALMVVTGIAAFVLNTRFWQLIVLNLILGAGFGTFIPHAQSIVFDSFDEKMRQFISGVQFSFINGGGIIMSVVGGFLATIVWYGGYLVMLMALPVLIVAWIVIPKGERIRPRSSGSKGAKLPKDVYYHAVLVFLFIMLHNVGPINLSTHIINGNMGDTATTGIATALMMIGGVVSGMLFPKLSTVFRDNIFPIAFVLQFIAFSMLNLFSYSLSMTLAAMFISGTSTSLFIPRCIFNVSNLTEPSNSATASTLISSVAAGSGGFLSPVIITNLTLAFGGDSTRFRYQFTAIVCLILAGLLLMNNIRRQRKTVPA